jgi:DNA repair protein RecO (recombination protein O)
VRRDAHDRAWVLHTRPWRETSLLLELFTPESGRLGVIARGARRPRRGGRALEPFVAVSCSLSGRGELRTLGAHEVTRRTMLAGDALYAGFYLNELLVRLLQREDPHERLFREYEGALAVLAGLPRGADPIALEPVLRRFEFALLDELGYGFPLTEDLDGAPVDPARRYTVLPDVGVRLQHPGVAEHEDEAALHIDGSELLAIAEGRLASPAVLRAAKRLARRALAPHLGDRPLVSRSLFGRARG